MRELREIQSIKKCLPSVRRNDRLTSLQRSQGALLQVVVHQVSPEAALACIPNHTDFIKL